MPVLIAKSTSATPLLFLLVQSSDHITGLTGASPTVTISKNGAAAVTPSGAISQVDATGMPGWYQVAGNATDTNTVGPIILHATAASADPSDTVVAQVIDPGVALFGSNVVNWLGTVVATPLTAGVPDINLKNIAGAAVATGTAQLGVNIVNIAGSASAGAAGFVGVDWAQVTNKTSVVALTNTTISSSQVVASVTGAVGSVTGSVGSVTGLSNTTIATAVWQDTTAGDFTVASSIGKSLYTSGVVPGAAGGLFIAGSNAATTVNITGNLTGNVTGSVGSISGVSFPTNFGALAITVGGNVGINWGNVANPSTAVNLSATTVNLVNTLTTYTGNTVQTGDAFARLGAPAGASVSADIAAVKAVLPTALTGAGNMKADVLAINGSTTAASNLSTSTLKIGIGTVGSGTNTTTKISTSSLTPANVAAGQFTGRIVIFDDTTATTSLRGQATSITTDDGAGNLTVVAMTTAPSAGDTFVIL